MQVPKDQGREESDFPSPREMEGWLQREISDAAKALELRVRDATQLVTAYSRGELSVQEAEEQSQRYSSRWGEAIPGVARSLGMSDEQILKQMDDSRAKWQQRHRASSPESNTKTPNL